MGNDVVARVDGLFYMSGFIVVVLICNEVLIFIIVILNVECLEDFYLFVCFLLFY